MRDTAGAQGPHRRRSRPARRGRRATCTTAASSSTPATRRCAFDTGEQRDRRSSACAASATVAVDGTSYALGRYDALYVPRDAPSTIAPGADGCDLAEIAAPVSKRASGAVRALRRRADRIRACTSTPAAPPSKRDLNVLIGKNVEAGRIMAGVTFSEPGNWTSWPPHEHAAMLEEAYLYIDMPAPAFGVQLVYTNPREPELATIVREGDVVLMPQGYHPNVAAPGGSINFLWMMAANREDDDRQYGVVNVQPDFGDLGSGLDKAERRRNDAARMRCSRFSIATGRRFPSSASPTGIERQMIWGERLMVCRLRFAPHVVTAVHSHPHEQITLVERGRVRLHRRRPAAHRRGRRRAACSRRTSSTARRCSTRKWC